MIFDGYKKNVFSQYGEDGVIEELLRVIADTDKWCVEFGAWDGIHLSNTHNLVKNKDYKAVLIEGSKSRYRDLLKLHEIYPNITPVNAFVDIDNNSLDKILSKTDIPKNFDLLSIDIDGNDYHIWNALKNYKPKLVVIEYNPTIPSQVKYVQEYSQNMSRGSSFKSLCDLGLEKGYYPIAATKTNIIFISSEYKMFFELEANIELIRTDTSAVTHIFFGYDGKVLLSGAKKIPWHSYGIEEADFEVFPLWLRQYPDSMSSIRKAFLIMYKKIKKIIRYLKS